MKRTILLSIAVIVCTAYPIFAELIRDGIDIDFVTIGNPGNSPDAQVMSDGTTGYGSVGYRYRIGKYEITNAQWDFFISGAGAPTGNPSGAYATPATYTGSLQPTGGVSWYEAAQFCNYLTSGDKSKGAYLFSGDNIDPGDFLGINRSMAIATYGIIYVLPTEDEWYKAAYYKPDSSGYSLFANGQDTIPLADNGWNYVGGLFNVPWNIGSGLQEQNGTFDMMGNVWEWNETIIYSPNHGLRGCSFYDYDYYALASSFRNWYAPHLEGHDIGFRVASIPEPCTLLLLGLGGLALRCKIRR